jgi:hypothetical protein
MQVPGFEPSLLGSWVQGSTTVQNNREIEYFKICDSFPSSLKSSCAMTIYLNFRIIKN